MLNYASRRLVMTFLVMGIVGLLVFTLLRLSPGDPAAIIAGDNASDQTIVDIRSKLGLDQPWFIQFATWFTSVLRGDLGVSIFSRTPVSTLILQRLGPTLSLTIWTLAIAVPVAICIGAIAALRAGSVMDRMLMAFAALGFSVPAFVVGYVFIYYFSITLQLLPVQGYSPLSEGFGPWAKSLVLPSVTLGLTYIALIARMTRTSVIEVLSEDYIRTARAKGLPQGKVLFKHALSNAAVPIVTVVGIGIALLISGVVITETVFNIPGIGRLTVDAIQKRDYPLIQGIMLVFSGVYVVVNLLVDLSYGYFDPRVRL